MNKRSLIRKILKKLGDERSLLLRAAKSAHAEATHEQSKAENKYDTRGLEASYLARGQSRQFAEAELAIQQFEALDARAFGPDDPIDVGALVEVKGAKGGSLYFIGPKSGGLEIEHERREVLVITPPSPLGQRLMGRKQGARFNMEVGGVRQELTLVSVS